MNTQYLYSPNVAPPSILSFVCFVSGDRNQSLEFLNSILGTNPAHFAAIAIFSGLLMIWLKKKQAGRECSRVFTLLHPIVDFVFVYLLCRVSRGCVPCNSKA